MQAPPPPPPQPMPITIFVHGTQMHALFKDADLSSWLPPSTQTPAGLYAVNDLEDKHQIKECLKALSEADNQSFPVAGCYAFGWSGSIDLAERQKAGKELFDLVKALAQSYQKRYDSNADITFITHSHGGNVLMHMAEHLVATPSFTIARAILCAIPVQQTTLKYINSPLFHAIYSLHSHDDVPQIMDQEWAQIIRSTLEKNKDVKGPQAIMLITTALKKMSTIGTERHFGSQHNLIQTTLRWQKEPKHTEHVDAGLYFELALYRAKHWFEKSRGLMHTEFTTPLFFKNLPSILRRLDAQREKKQLITECLSLAIEGA